MHVVFNDVITVSQSLKTFVILRTLNQKLSDIYIERSQQLGLQMVLLAYDSPFLIL